MKLDYHPDTDSLYTDLADRSAADSREVQPGVVMDFDEAGGLVGIDIDHASRLLSLDKLEVSALPFDTPPAAAARRG